MHAKRLASGEVVGAEAEAEVQDTSHKALAEVEEAAPTFDGNWRVLD